MARLKCGIVGLPNVGKSTLFNALTAVAAEASNYPFCTIDPNIGVVDVVDERIDRLAELSHSKKVIYASMEFVDIAGLVAGAHKGEGLGNKFLANIRETDAIVQVVRCFDGGDIVHVSGSVDPIRDVEVINLELVLADLQMCENVVAKLEKQAKGNRDLLPELDCLKKVLAHLNEEQLVRTLPLSDEEKEIVDKYHFLTAKKTLYVANVSEEELPEMENDYVRRLKEHAENEGSLLIAVCARIEEEIAQLPKEERGEFLKDLGLEQSGLDRLIHASFKLLGLITYITTGEMETRAWTIEEGTLAAEAAGKIHSDIEKGFIRAEVVAFDDMIACGGRVEARSKGKARSEGKEYCVKDGDVILFLHN